MTRTTKPTRKPERLTDGHEGDIVVFLIGMTVNKPWRPDLWGPVFTAMPPMIAELERNAATRGTDQWWGYLGSRYLISTGGPMLVQYWRSTDDLVAYAGDNARAHRPAWGRFNAMARKAGRAVGVWHETYDVPAGRHESIYVDTPPLGLAKVTSLIPVGRRGDHAKARLAAG